MLNRVILMGRLTAEPDYRTTQSGAPFARFTLAVDRDYTPQGAERKTDFLDIIVWRNTADFVSKYFHKGQLVAVQGTIQVNSYTDREGNKRRSWDVVADQVYNIQQTTQSTKGGFIMAERPERRGRKGRKKVCSFCVDKIKEIDYKDVNKLRRYVSDRAKILPRRVTGTCAFHQRQLTVAIKRARHVALMPYTAD